MAKASKFILVCGAIGIILALLLPNVQTIRWVGHCDLEIEFSVSNSDSGDPISGAVVHVHQERGGFCEDRSEKDFDLTTGPNGCVSPLCKTCMCFGSRGTQINTFAVHLPDWTFRVSAAGYQETDLIFLDTYSRDVRRGEPAVTLKVPVVLQQDTAAGGTP
jgi:hypothetical protein